MLSRTKNDAPMQCLRDFIIIIIIIEIFKVA